MMKLENRESILNDEFDDALRCLRFSMPALMFSIHSRLYEHAEAMNLNSSLSKVLQTEVQKRETAAIE